MSHVDLHCHLLPGLDDGARDLAATLAYARRLDADGVLDVACTPHVKRRHFPRVPLAELAERRADVQAAIAADGLRVRLHPGGELAHEEAFDLHPDDLAQIAQGPADAPWLLLECPFEGIDREFLEAADLLRGLGYGLLLAHPERVEQAPAAVLERLRPLLVDGAMLQVNVSSLLGRHGSAARATARRLVRARLAHCVASDGHPGTRDELLSRGPALLRREGLAAHEVRRLTSDNPARLLREGSPVAAPARDEARLAAA